MTSDPAPSMFVRPRSGATPTTESGETVADAVYRVVGTPDDSVTLLRVGDTEGNRDVTGEILSVSRATYENEFEETTKPSGRGLLVSLLSRITVQVHLLLKPFYWLRRKLR
jgi:hypothetical protein